MKDFQTAFMSGLAAGSQRWEGEPGSVGDYLLTSGIFLAGGALAGLIFSPALAVGIGIVGGVCDGARTAMEGKRIFEGTGDKTRGTWLAGVASMSIGVALTANPVTAICWAAGKAFGAIVAFKANSIHVENKEHSSFIEQVKTKKDFKH